jgi:NAD(P)-dependent dehydrogenase (short-subunit alcohol dehydrogenase family)
MTSNLTGKNVVVIGGSSGIGKEVARLARELGASVVIGSRSPEKLAAARGELGDDVRTGVVDILDEESMRSFFGAIGALDHLVVSVGDMANGAIADLSLDAIHQCLNTKIVGPFLAVRHAVATLAPSGSIVLFSGGGGFKPAPGLTMTAAGNGAVPAMARAMALELAPIRVNTIVPGLIDTPLWSDLPDEFREQLFADTGKSLPSGRVGKAEDVAEMVVQMLVNTYVTGSVMHVDGGFLL